MFRWHPYYNEEQNFTQSLYDGFLSLAINRAALMALLNARYEEQLEVLKTYAASLPPNDIMVNLLISYTIDVEQRYQLLSSINNPTREQLLKIHNINKGLRQCNLLLNEPRNILTNSTNFLNAHNRFEIGDVAWSIAYCLGYAALIFISAVIILKFSIPLCIAYVHSPYFQSICDFARDSISNGVLSEVCPIIITSAFAYGQALKNLFFDNNGISFFSRAFSLKGNDNAIVAAATNRLNANR